MLKATCMRNSITAAPLALLWIVQLLANSSARSVVRICEESLPGFCSHPSYLRMLEGSYYLFHRSMHRKTMPDGCTMWNRVRTAEFLTYSGGREVECLTSWNIG